MRTTLNNASLLKNHDAITVLYGGESVRDDKGRPAVHELIHTILDHLLGSRID